MASAGHAQVIRATAIAFCCQNVCSGMVYGPFSVLVASVESKYGVNRELSTLALPLMSAAVAICAPFVGVLAERISLRLLMILGSLMGAAGYGLLAFTDSFAIFLAVHALLFGPALCLGAVVVPSTLITRSFKPEHRGRALGIVHMPLLLGPIALVAAVLLRRHDLESIYLLFAGIYLLNTLVVTFAVDPPPVASPALDGSAPAAVLPLRGVLKSGPFWLITIAFAAMLSGAVITSGQLVPMASEWGLETTLAATLFTGMSLAGLIGTPAIGWVIDKLGARTTVALICLNCGVLWASLLLQPPFPVLAVVIVLLGFHGGAVMPVFSSACSEVFGAAAFSRTFGLAKMMTLPFTLLAVPAVAAIYVRTGSYLGAQAMQAGFMLIAALLIMIANLRTGRSRAAAAS